MMSTVFTKSYDTPEIDGREILRYAGARSEDAATVDLLRECVAEVGHLLSYKVAYVEAEVSVSEGDLVDLGFVSVRSSSLKKQLDGCSSAVIFAATVGIELDRRIARYSRVSPSRALMLQAFGTERIEALCDAFCEDIKKEKALLKKGVKGRFSAGYGDLPLEMQRDIFALLDCPKRIGLSLNESLLMSPTKSVTAIVGITDASDE